MMRISMSSLAFSETHTCSWKKNENVFAQRPLHLFPVVILASGNRQGTLTCGVNSPHLTIGSKTRHPDIEEQ